MRVIAIIIMLSLCASAGAAASIADCTGLVRAFGDVTSWMSSSFVVGDGSWVLAPADAVTEKVGPTTDQTVRYPIFISNYTGLAYQCELKHVDKDLGGRDPQAAGERTAGGDNRPGHGVLESITRDNGPAHGRRHDGQSLADRHSWNHSPEERQDL